MGAATLRERECRCNHGGAAPIPSGFTNAGQRSCGPQGPEPRVSCSRTGHTKQREDAAPGRQRRRRRLAGRHDRGEGRTMAAAATSARSLGATAPGRTRRERERAERREGERGEGTTGGGGEGGGGRAHLRRLARAVCVASPSPHRWRERGSERRVEGGRQGREQAGEGAGRRSWSSGIYLFDRIRTQNEKPESRTRRTRSRCRRNWLQVIQAIGWKIGRTKKLEATWTR